MKRELNMLENFREKISEKISNREDIYLSRTYEWQESEKGEDYQDKTFQLEELLDNIDESINNLETYLEIYLK